MINTKHVTLAVLAAAIIGISYMQYSNTSSTRMSSDNETKTTEAMLQNVQDGTYDAVGAYTSPAGPEKLGVELEIKDNKVVTATVTVFETNEKTKLFQNMFKESFSAQVIGKDIRTLKLDKVAASSLTPKGFNDAVKTILAQAQG